MRVVVPHRIREARLSQRMSQEALASRVRTSRQNVLRWEKGHNTPRAEHVAAIAEATGRPLEFFFGDDEDEEAALAAELLHVVRRVALAARVGEVAA